MSFLLDALRKSEDQKRRGPVPTIHGGELAPAERRYPAAALYGLLILLPLLLVIAWYLSRESGNGDEIEATVAVPTQATGQAAGAVSQNEPASNAAAESGGVNTKRVPDPASQNSPRTPVEQIASSPESGSGSPSNSQNATVRALPERQPETVNREDLDPGPAKTVELAPSRPAATPAQRVQRDADAPMPGMITFWELPGSVRSDIVDMNISVSVYAERPEDRFILMNGARWGEGDEPQRGLRIEEIRRDGIVFTFRRYRFLRTL